ncbi:hypothetical protein [Janibacter massiliensis]|uniref:hypothetical protein n=1 Tax=Janibacter massiliensis TaxID=2058291 RepID=UPI000D10BAC6|nr:hypothetical protein [Janibacter massiliensis]
MKPYADIPARRGAQMAGDLLVGAWCLAWAWVGTVVHRATMRLAAPGHRLEEAGRDFRGRMDGAGSQVDDLPILDDRVAGPFREAAGAGTSIETAGHDLVVAVERLALLLGLTTALLPILVVGGWWLLRRVRFARLAGASQRLVDGAPDLDLFALRAMANQPLPRLAAITDDPAGAWRAGDARVIRELALLELRTVGLRPPPSA